MHILDILTTHTDSFSFGTYLFILIIALLESLPMFGFFVPGQIVAVTAGLIAHTGTLNIFNVWFFLSVGAILGDLIGYFLGKKYGENFILKYGKYFFLSQTNFKKTRDLINAHSGKTIVIGRFNSVTRAFTPFVAGSSKINFLKFLFYAILGGISWAISFSLLGYIFGNNYKSITNYFGEFVVVALIIGATIIYLYKYFNKKRRIFYRRHLYILLINLLSLYIFFRMLDNFVEQELLIKWDIWINNYVIYLRNPLWDKFFIIITNLGGTLFLSISSIILLIFFISKKKWRYSLLLILSMIGGKMFEVLAKYIIGRNRPENSIIEASGFSLPSGHATMSIIFFTLLIYYFKNHITNKKLKQSLITMSVLIIIFIGTSRIYLGVHWFTDVVAGFSLGLFWLTLMILTLEATTTIFKEKVSEIKNHLNR